MATLRMMFQELVSVREQLSVLRWEPAKLYVLGRLS